MKANTRFKFQDKVVVVKGFYRGLKGTITDYAVTKKGLFKREVIEYKVVMGSLSDVWNYDQEGNLIHTGHRFERVYFTEDLLELV